MRLALFALLLTSFTACQCNQDAACKETIRNKPVIGGYSKVLNQEETQIIEAIELVKARISQELKMDSYEFKVLNIQQQVVAGMNYRMTILIRFKNNAGIVENKKFNATVWSKLDNTKVITDFRAI